MPQFFDKFPVIQYDISGKQLSSFTDVTNVFFRIQVIRSVLANINAYYVYDVEDDQTPEILADKVYDNPEAHWIILLANDIVDPQYDWPLSYNEFNKYIIGKYGSVENAQTTYHHYEKVIVREDTKSGIITEDVFWVNEEGLTDNEISYYNEMSYEDLPEDGEFVTHNMQNGKTVLEKTFRRRITNYDYELDLNEKKRSIKIIKPEYYNQIIREFDNLTRIELRTPYIRRLV